MESSESTQAMTAELLKAELENPTNKTKDYMAVFYKFDMRKSFKNAAPAHKVRSLKMGDNLDELTEEATAWLMKPERTVGDKVDIVRTNTPKELESPTLVFCRQTRAVLRGLADIFVTDYSAIRAKKITFNQPPVDVVINPEKEVNKENAEMASCPA